MRYFILVIASLLSITSFSQDPEFLLDSDTTEFFGCAAFYNPALEPSLVQVANLTTGESPSYWYQKNIPVVVHILYSDSIPDSYVPYEHVVEAIDDLDSQFEGTDFNFELVNVDYTEVLDYFWGDYYIDGTICFYNSINVMDEYADDVNWNTNQYMNVYVVPKMCRSLLGFAWIHFNPYSDVYGVWVKTKAFGLSGDYLQFPYIENKTLSHEVGHYLGLHHVFNGVSYCGQNDGVPCEYDGDLVCDTPPTKVNYSCENPVCPPGLYNYTPNNHMDYYPDSCRTAFTPGQINRMHFMTDFHHADMFDQGEPFCNGDFNGDGYVGTMDMLQFLSCYNGTNGNIYTEECYYTDFDNNGVLTIMDLNLFLTFYGYDCSNNPNLLLTPLSEETKQMIISKVGNPQENSKFKVGDLLQLLELER